MGERQEKAVRLAVTRLRNEGAAEIWARDSEFPPPDPIRIGDRILLPDVVARFEDEPGYRGNAALAPPTGAGARFPRQVSSDYFEWVVVRVESEETFDSPSREEEWRDFADYARRHGSRFLLMARDAGIAPTLCERVREEVARLGLKDVDVMAL